MNYLYRLLLALLVSAYALPALASVSATVDRNNIGSGDTVQLQLQHDGSTDSQPDLSPLRQDFDVLGRSSGSNVQIINGHMSSKEQVTVLLSPKHDGNLQIPPLQWDGQQSQAIQLSVGGSGNATSQNDKIQGNTSHVFITTTLSQKQPYVQAADVLTVRLYMDQPLYQASLDLPASSDVLVKQLGKDSQTSQTRNGRTYQVVERKYLLFPQRSGKLRLDGPVLDAQIQNTHSNDPFGNDPMLGNLFGQLPLAGMLNATRPIRLHADPVELNVLKRPAGATGTNWLPAQKVTLQESWRPDTATMRVGEPLTRHLHLAALGLTGAQLPDPGSLMSLPDGIKAYPDQSKADEVVQGESVLGTRDEDIALIASRPGRFELPAVHLNWWDTINNIQHAVTLPARTIEILPAAPGSIAATLPPIATAQPSNQPDTPDLQAALPGAAAKTATTVPWTWVSLALALLWFGTLFAWWFTHRRASPTQQVPIKEQHAAAVPKAATSFKEFRDACRRNDAHEARKQLLAWAVSAWPGNPPAGLNELSRRLDDAATVAALRQLDRACYTGETWQGKSLAESLPTPPVLANSTAARQELPALYH